MPRILLTLVLILFLALPGRGQSPAEGIEGLKAQLKNAKSDGEKARICGDLSYYYATLSADSSLRYGEQSLIFARRSKNDTLTAQAYNDLATASYLKGQYETALDYCRKSFHLRKLLQDEAGIASLYIKLGNNFYRTTRYDSSMYYYLKARDYYQKVGNILTEKTIESNISTVYQSLGNYDKAIDYLKAPIEYFEKNGEYLRLSNNLINLANIQIAKGDTLTAIASYFEAEKACELGGNVLGLGALYNNLGETYFHLKDLPKAVEYITKSIEIRQKQGYDADLYSSFLTLGSSYFRQGNYTKAKPFLLKAAQGLEASDTFDKLSGAYQQLTTVYAFERDTDSLNIFLARAASLKNDMLQREVRELTQELEEKYQSAQKDKAILEQGQTIQARELALQKQTTWLISVAGLALLLVVVLFYIYKQKQTATRQAALEVELAKEQERSRIQEERLRISRELHDNIGSYLSMIKVSIEQLPEMTADKSSQNLPRLNDILGLSMRELRKTVWLLNNQEVSIDDLAIRLRDFFKPLQQNGSAFSVEVQGDSDIELSDIQATHLFRIIQEAVNNAYRHGEAGEIKVVLKGGGEDLIEFSISDNGRGYHTDQVQRGNGLQNMKARIAELNGKIHISSSPGKGTAVKGHF